MQRKRLSSVCKFDVKSVGQSLKYSLMTQKICLKEIDQYLFSKENLKTKQMTINELKDQLTKSPFNMTNEVEITQLARYLVEDNNTQGFIDFNPDAQQCIQIIRSVFKALLDQYTLFDEDREQLVESVKQIIETQSLQSPILDSLSKVRAHKKLGGADLLNPDCSMEEFNDVIELLELHHLFKQRQIDFICYELYQTTQNLEKMSLMKFFSIYGEAQ